MANLGEEIQLRVKQSLEAELSFYAGRGLINKEEQLLIADTFREASKVASTALPLELHQRPIVFTQPTEIQDKSLSEKIEEAVENVMVKLGVKATYDDSPWDGSAGQWKTAEAYCASCLIDMNDGSGPKTKDRCKLPYKKPGSGAVNKGALRAMASGGRGLSAMKGVPKDQMVKAANFMIRHWQGAFDKPAPASIYRMAGKKPPEDSKESTASFFKDKAGQWWMLGIYSNRWMDREHEILSEAAHKEYAEWVNTSGFKPQVIVYHLPKMPNGFWEKVWDKWGNDIDKLNEITKKVFQKTSIGEVDRIVYANGFSVAVTKIYPDKYEAAERLSELKDIGMSHGFLVYEEEDPSSFSSLSDTVNIVSKYRSFEMSVLLRKRAANYGTAPLFMEGKSVTLSDEDRKMIASVLGDEIAAALDENTATSSEVMNAMLEHKELSDPETPEEVKSEPPVVEETKPVEPEVKAVPPTEEDEEEDEEEDMEKGEKEVKQPESVDEEKKTESKEGGMTEEKVVETVLKVLNIDQLQTVLTTLMNTQRSMMDEIAELKAAKETVVAEVKQLQQTEDEKIAAKFTPVNWGGVGFSPATSAETAVPKEVADKKLEGGPSTETPLFTGNPLAEVFWNTIK